MKHQKLIQPIWIILGLVLIALSPMMAMPISAADDFTIVVLPDTQLYSESYPYIFEAQTQWIVNEKNNPDVTTPPIVYVAHEGDLVNDWKIPDKRGNNQWLNAVEAMNLLDNNNIPYGVLPGNHDGICPWTDYEKYPPPFQQPWPNPPIPIYDTSKYNEYFGISRFVNKPYYGGHYGDNNDNNYALFSEGGMDFIVINLAFFDNENDYVTLTFNIDPNKQYDVAVTYNRNKVEYPDRVTKFTLLGADDTYSPVSFSTGDNYDNGYVAEWGPITAEDGSFSIKAEYNGGPAAYAMTSVRLREWVYYGDDGPSFTAYIDLHSEAGDYNDPKVLKIVPDYVYPETSIYPPIDPNTNWVLKDFDNNGADLNVTMQVDMQVGHATLNGADSADGTRADEIFGGIVDGVGNYELEDKYGFPPHFMDILDWADNLLRVFSDRRAIVVSHSLIDRHGNWTYPGRKIWEHLKGNPNLFLMLGGHMWGEARRTDVGDNGNRVDTLLANYQARPNGGNGCLRIMEFLPDNNIIRVKPYSPYDRDYLCGTDFTLPWYSDPPGFTAYIDLHSQAGDFNDPKVLKIVPDYVYPETSIYPPIDPNTNWVLKDFDNNGADLNVTMQVDMQVGHATLNGADSADGTRADEIFGGIVDGVGNYELLDNDYVTLTFNNLDPQKQYDVAVTYNRNRVDYEDRVTKFTLLEADDTYPPIIFSTGDNDDKGYVAEWTGITADDRSFSVKAEYNGGPAAYAMTSVRLQEREKNPSFTAYIDLHSQDGDNNHPNVLKIVPDYVYPETSIYPPIDPNTNWVLKDFDSGNDLAVTMQVDMQVGHATTNGADSADGTRADEIFGGIVDGVGNYELEDPDYVTLTFNNLDPQKQYDVAVTYNRNRVDYEDRVTKFTLLEADDTYPPVSFSTGNNYHNGDVAEWTGITADDRSFSVKAEYNGGPAAYAMTSVRLQEEP